MFYFLIIQITAHNKKRVNKVEWDTKRPILVYFVTSSSDIVLHYTDDIVKNAHFFLLEKLFRTK